MYGSTAASAPMQPAAAVRPPDAELIARVVIQLRRRAITQTVVADESRVSASSLSQWKSGKVVSEAVSDAMWKWVLASEALSRSPGGGLVRGGAPRPASYFPPPRAYPPFHVASFPRPGIISPSGSGLEIFGHGTAPGLSSASAVAGYPSAAATGLPDGGALAQPPPASLPSGMQLSQPQLDAQKRMLLQQMQRQQELQKLQWQAQLQQFQLRFAASAAAAAASPGVASSAAPPPPVAGALTPSLVGPPSFAYPAFPAIPQLSGARPPIPPSATPPAAVSVPASALWPQPHARGFAAPGGPSATSALNPPTPLTSAAPGYPAWGSNASAASAATAQLAAHYFQLMQQQQQLMHQQRLQQLMKLPSAAGPTPRAAARGAGQEPSEGDGPKRSKKRKVSSTEETAAATQARGTDVVAAAPVAPAAPAPSTHRPTTGISISGGRASAAPAPSAPLHRSRDIPTDLESILGPRKKVKTKVRIEDSAAPALPTTKIPGPAPVRTSGLREAGRPKASRPAAARDYSAFASAAAPAPDRRLNPAPAGYSGPFSSMSADDFARLSEEASSLLAAKRAEEVNAGGASALSAGAPASTVAAPSCFPSVDPAAEQSGARPHNASSERIEPRRDAPAGGDRGAKLGGGGRKGSESRSKSRRQPGSLLGSSVARRAPTELEASIAVAMRALIESMPAELRAAAALRTTAGEPPVNPTLSALAHELAAELAADPSARTPGAEPSTRQLAVAICTADDLFLPPRESSDRRRPGEATADGPPSLDGPRGAAASAGVPREDVVPLATLLLDY